MRLSFKEEENNNLVLTWQKKRTLLDKQSLFLAMWKASFKKNGTSMNSNDWKLQE